jgi:hypothetical protein
MIDDNSIETIISITFYLEQKRIYLIYAARMSPFTLAVQVRSCICCYFQNHALLNRVQNATSEDDRRLLSEISCKQHMVATLLPIRSVGVQVSIHLGGKKKKNLI